MTYLFHAAVCLFEHKPMLNLYDTSNLAGGSTIISAAASAEEKVGRNFKEKKPHIYFKAVKKAISILSYGTACPGCII